MKIGFACKYLDRFGDKKIEKQFNVTTTTAKHLSTVDAEQKLDSVVEHNLSATKKLIKYVSTLPDELKMVRFSSNILPLFTHKEFCFILYNR